MICRVTLILVGSIHMFQLFTAFVRGNQQARNPRAAMAMPTVHLLDYVAGNVRSLVNAIEKLGFSVEWVKEPADISKAEVQKNRNKKSSQLSCAVN